MDFRFNIHMKRHAVLFPTSVRKESMFLLIVLSDILSIVENSTRLGNN